MEDLTGDLHQDARTELAEMGSFLVCMSDNFVDCQTKRWASDGDNLKYCFLVIMTFTVI